MIPREEAPEWEVIPSISLEAGEAVAQALGTSNFVIEVDVEAAKTTLENIQDYKAKPGIVHFYLEKLLRNIGTDDHITLGTAQYNKDGSTTVKVSLFGKLGTSTMLLNPTRMQKSAVHELKHAADFTIKSVRRADHKFYKKAVKEYEAEIKRVFHLGDDLFKHSMSLEEVSLSEELLLEEALKEFVRKMSKEAPLEKKVQAIDTLAHDQIIKISKL